MTNQVITFGCRLNAYESEAIKEALGKSKEDNLIVFNSCAVTSEAERQLRQSIRKAARDNPHAKIIVTGCAAQINPQKYAQMSEVSMVLGNQDKLLAENYSSSVKSSKNQTAAVGNSNIAAAHQDQIFYKENNQIFNPALEEKILVNDIMSITETASHLVSSFENKSRAFVQVQNGCNHRCTFCIIPYGRGNSRSVPLGEVVDQIRKLVAAGYKEVVLTGVDITDYGKDLLAGISFSQMVKRLLKLVPELPRLRISSVDVAEIDHDFLDIIANEERLMPYLHISLQSGDDMILKRMKRRHNRQQVVDFCNQVRRIRDNVTFGSDIIAGFPTESEEMFNNTLNLISETGIIFNHIFPYSIRTGTPAAKMKQISADIKKERARKLREATKNELYKFLDSQIGKTHKVILEDNNLVRCENFITARINDNYLLTNDIFEVQILSREGDLMIAKSC